jgi:long-chain acyl-CoA synthetase
MADLDLVAPDHLVARATADLGSILPRAAARFDTRPALVIGDRIFTYAELDEEGHFFVVDRKKDMIITGGYNVYPAEIERVIATHPAVSMIAVESRPDPVRGELARACVVLRPGSTATETEIIEHCRPHLAPYKLPRSVAVVSDLPKTSTGKIMRRELRKLDS